MGSWEVFCLLEVPALGVVLVSVTQRPLREQGFAQVALQPQLTLALEADSPVLAGQLPEVADLEQVG